VSAAGADEVGEQPGEAAASGLGADDGAGAGEQAAQEGASGGAGEQVERDGAVAGDLGG
jgi:hypothetical protein